MASNRKRHAMAADDSRWVLLGELLQARRQELGFRFRPAFARDRLPLTPDGNLNVRLAADIENNYRGGSYPPGTLRLLAQAYEVTYESVQAVLSGAAGSVAPAPAAAPAEPPGWTPPVDDATRIASDRPYADRIWERLRQLAARGITAPSGSQVFPPGSADARDWDGAGSRLDLADRVWFIAGLQRRDAGRAGSSGAGAAGA